MKLKKFSKQLPSLIIFFSTARTIRFYEKTNKKKMHELCKKKINCRCWTLRPTSLLLGWIGNGQNFFFKFCYFNLKDHLN